MSERVEWVIEGMSWVGVYGGREGGRDGGRREGGTDGWQMRRREGEREGGWKRISEETDAHTYSCTYTN